jgi:hypothetical protein
VIPSIHGYLVRSHLAGLPHQPNARAYQSDENGPPRISRYVASGKCAPLQADAQDLHLRNERPGITPRKSPRANRPPTASCQGQWWAHLRFIPVNIDPTMLCNQIEDHPHVLESVRFPATFDASARQRRELTVSRPSAESPPTFHRVSTVVGALRPSAAKGEGSASHSIGQHARGTRTNRLPVT